MNSIEIFRLLEKKDHIIKKLNNLTDEQKQAAIDFFGKHPNYENEIDWNRKDLSWEDFEAVINKPRVSKNQMKKASKSDNTNWLTEGSFYDVLYEGEKFTIYQPLTYIGSRYLASKDAAPHTEAKWCISYQKTRDYWKEYTFKRRCVFLFVFTNSHKYALQIPVDFNPNSVDTFFEGNFSREVTIWDEYDNTMDSEDFIEELSLTKEDIAVFYNLLNTVYDNFYETIFYMEVEDLRVLKELKNKATLSRKNLFYKKLKDKKEKGIPFVWESDLYYTELLQLDLVVVDGNDCYLSDALSYVDELKGNLTYDISDFEDDEYDEYDDYDEEDDDNSKQHYELTRLGGCPKRILGDFDCSFNSLTSLEGSPEYVQGTFKCSDNEITSLEGGPKFVGGIYQASRNKLTNLKGSPKQIDTAFLVRDNLLTSLEGAPEKVIGTFDISFNETLESLDFAPKEVNWFLCEFTSVPMNMSQEQLLPNTKVNFRFVRAD